jgi:hypothetical protein
MDLVYIPEVLTFGSFRSPQYRDYEQPWNRNYFDDGKTTAYNQQRHQSQLQSQPHRDSKDSCHLCKENKRRSLAAYIRGKTRQNSCSEICEEEEEEETQQQAEPGKPEHKPKKPSA